MLIKKDIEKKKEALEEEKNLIDERLQARKDAEDEAAKYEELAELQKQLAMISMDSTRTKDAAELRKKIASIQGEIGWDIAEDDAEAAKKAIDDQIEAYNDFETSGDEALEKYLEDANNFADEVNKVMSMNQKNLLKWLKANDEEYKNSLDDTQESIVQGWTDTYKQMKGIVDTYWKEIAKIMSSKNSFIEYMKGSTEYKAASKTEKAEMVYNWGVLWDTMHNAEKNGNAETHKDDVSSLGTTGKEKKKGSGSNSGTKNTKGTNNTGTPPEGPEDDTSKAGHGGNMYGYEFTFNGKTTTSNPIYDTSSDAITAGKLRLSQLQTIAINGVNYDINKLESAYKNRSKDQAYGMKKQELEQKKKALEKGATVSSVKYTYMHGGLVDYTGPAWVDGTKQRPEAFLSAVDTQNIRDLLDAFNYIKTPRMSYYDTMKLGNTTNSIGTVSVTINGAQFEDDADYEAIAQRVGEEFARELQKQGFNTSNYAF